MRRDAPDVAIVRVRPPRRPSGSPASRDGTSSEPERARAGPSAITAPPGGTFDLETDRSDGRPNPMSRLDLLTLTGLTALAALVAVAPFGAPSARAQDAQPAEVAEPAESTALAETPSPAPVFRVGALELEYATAHPDHPDLDAILPVEVVLTRSETGWRAPAEGERGEPLLVGGAESPVLELEASALARVLVAVVGALNERGLVGVDVRPAARDIDPASEVDRRPAERTQLALVVHTGRIAKVRTIAVGDRIRDDWKIDNVLHAKIREGSPLAAAGEGDEGTSDLLDRRRLEDYLYRLNRYGGRMVEAALSPGEEPGDVVLDYRVHESKPWYVYAQGTNTGTTRTAPWQTRAGVAHTQLSNHDDTLSVEWLNAGGKDVNALSARYDAPFFGARRRPEWMNRRKGDPEWIAWFPREKLPWWGVDRMRWGLDFAWNRSLSGRNSTLAGLDEDPIESQQFDFGGRLAYEVVQVRDFFVDLVGGFALSDLRIENGVSANVGEALLAVPRAGVHAERINQLSTFTADVGVQGQVNEIDEGDLASLGRAATDERYATIDFNLGWSAFLEPLLRPSAWRDPSNELAATLAHEISLGLRGQYGFDYRLIPQASQTLGGLYSVRGYDQSIAVGDTVAVGSFEYRFHLPRALPVSRRPLRLPGIGDFRATPQQIYGRPDWDLVLRTFLDAGRAIRNDASASGTGAQEFDQTLIGAGIGAELVFRSNLRARIDYAFPLKSTDRRIKNQAEVGDSALHVLISVLY